MIGSELPKGWKLVPLKEITSIIRGVSYPKEEAKLHPEENYVHILRGGNIQDGKIVFETDDNVYVNSSLVGEEQFVLKDDVVIVASTGSKKVIGKAATIEEDSRCISFGAFLLLLRTNVIDKRFHSYFFQTQYYRNTISSLAGGININNIKKEHIENLQIPLPPLTEQKQIAEKLDKLFDQIETIKEASNKIPELLKNFRQQVLTYAVTGKLIESTPEPRMLGELIDELKYGTSKKADYDIEGFPVLRIPNINNGEIDSSDLKYVPLDDKEYNQLSLQEGDILVIRSNGSLSIVGQCAIVRKECENWVYAGYLIRIRCTHELLPEYLNYIFQSYQVRKQIVEKSHSMSGVNNFSADKIKQLEIAWYPVEVQKQIVEKLNSIFDKLNEIEKQYNTLCEKLEKLPQTLLCKAFKGELV